MTKNLDSRLQKLEQEIKDPALPWTLERYNNFVRQLWLVYGSGPEPTPGPAPTREEFIPSINEGIEKVYGPQPKTHE
jgi:hypothetical protein